MSQITALVKAYVARSRQFPQTAGDAETLAMLEDAANAEGSAAYAATHAPIAPDTFEVQTTIQLGQSESPQEQFAWDTPVEIVGFVPTIVDLADSGGAKLAATLNDIGVELRDGNNRILTKSRGTGLATGATANSQSNYVSLPAIAANPTRLFRLRLSGPSPVLYARFSLKRGANVHNGTRIGLAALVRYADS